MHYKEIPMIIGQMAVMRLLSAFFYLPQNGGQRKCQYEKKSRDDFARGLFLKINQDNFKIVPDLELTIAYNNVRKS